MPRNPSTTRFMESLKAGNGVQAHLVPAVYKPVGPAVIVHMPGPQLEQKYPRDNAIRDAIWGGPTGHPAAMNARLLLDLARWYVPASGVVLDPFGGIGTTALAAWFVHRVILCELEPHWAEIAKVATANVHRLPLPAPVVQKAQLRWIAENSTGADLVLVPPPSRIDVLNKDSRTLTLADTGGLVDAIITSPPYLDTFGHPGRGEWVVGKRSRAYTHRHNSPNLARERNPHLFKNKLAQVYQAALRTLWPGGVVVLVTKDPIRKGVRYPFALEQIVLGRSFGLELRDWWRRVVNHSYFQRIYRQKHPEAPRVDHEDILVFEYNPSSSLKALGDAPREVA